MTRRAAMAGLATMAALALLPGAASAATVAVYDRPGDADSGAAAITVVAVEALPGEANDLTFTTAGETVVVRDPAVALTPGDGCGAAVSGEITCRGVTRAISGIWVNAGDGDDTVDASATALAVVANGGPGPDVLAGGGADDTLIGNGGDDRLNGGPGDDYLWGGIGADALDGGTGDDELDVGGDPSQQRGDVVTCGAGFDTVDTPAAFEQLADACERVTISIPGTTALPVTLRPLHRVRGGMAMRVTCTRPDGGRGCRVHVVVHITGRRPLRADVTVKPGHSTLVHLHGTPPPTDRQVRVTISGDQLNAKGDEGGPARFRGGFFTTARRL